MLPRSQIASSMAVARQAPLVSGDPVLLQAGTVDVHRHRTRQDTNESACAQTGRDVTFVCRLGDVSSSIGRTTALQALN